ncbi:MAG: hypothetical protein KGQ43_00430 [Acidobacteria bacterium]|nr:hypothetical protein [Acidobacteriota bacterium]
MRKTAAALLVALVCLGCGNSDSSSSSEADGTADSTARPLPTTPQGDVELCSLATDALPGSAEEPATNEALAKSLTQRAELMLRIAESSTGELADALTMSSDAMSRLADAIANNADPSALDGLLSSLTEDTEFVAAQVTIDDAVTGACGKEQ